MTVQLLLVFEAFGWLGVCLCVCLTAKLLWLSVNFSQFYLPVFVCACTSLFM